MSIDHLVIGASGLVGSAIMAELKKQGKPCIGTYHSHRQGGLIKLDMCNEAQIKKVYTKYKPKYIYICGAETNVDQCEINFLAENIDGPRNVVNAAPKNARLIFFSSDYVFDGKNGPYKENEKPCPINIYGANKYYLEQKLRDNKNVNIIRTSWVYGPDRVGKSFISRILILLRAKKKIKIPEDQFSTPTYSPDIAKLAIYVVENKKIQDEIFHAGGWLPTDKYNFAYFAALVWDLDTKLIIPVKTKVLKQIAPRPLNGGLRTMKKTPIQMCSFIDGLKELYKIQ